MSRNCNKTAMCNVCGKVMRNDNLKRHVSLMHGNTKNYVQCIEDRQQPSNLLMNSQHYNKVKVEGSEIDESDDLLLNDVKVKFSKNVEYYRLIPGIVEYC